MLFIINSKRTKPDKNKLTKLQTNILDYQSITYSDRRSISLHLIPRILTKSVGENLLSFKSNWMWFLLNKSIKKSAKK